ncbi:MAG: MaoC family dehydratase [Polyangiales bacterium]
MQKTNPGNFFEDFVVGSELIHAVPRTITEGDCALYIGLTGDRIVLPSSANLSRAVGYPREPVNDLLTFHMVFGKTVNDISLNAVANLGYAGVKFLQPVFPGDTVRTVSKVLGKKENSNGKTGVVWVQSIGTNQRNEVVLQFYRWVMVHKKSRRADRCRRQPEDAQRGSGKRTYRSAIAQLEQVEPWASGARAGFDDYEIGEKIDHVDGMTIEESEHAIATRLYQNTAKVHFDAHAMQSSRFKRRLMYGGHVISIARSLSFNGLENSVCTLAWNSGAHANPTFAGDTIYAYTEILDKANCGT